jgi:hypothetical protein
LKYIDVLNGGVGIVQSVKRQPGFDSQQCKIFFFSSASTPALSPIQFPIQWVPGVLFPWVKRQGREADHSLAYSAEVKKGGAIALFHHMYSWHSAHLINHCYAVVHCLKLLSPLLTRGLLPQPLSLAVCVGDAL